MIQHSEQRSGLYVASWSHQSIDAISAMGLDEVIQGVSADGEGKNHQTWSSGAFQGLEVKKR